MFLAANSGLPHTVNWISMPELPEVETIARGLHKRVAGDTIESVWLGEKPEPLKSPANEIVEVLEGSRIRQVRRVGKHIVFDLERAGKGKRKAIQHGQWIVHLGMTGRMQVTTPDAELAKHTHAVAKLASGREVRFVDPRRFGRLAVVRMDSQQSATGIRRSRRRATGVADSSASWRYFAAARPPSRAHCSTRSS